MVLHQKANQNYNLFHSNKITGLFSSLIMQKEDTCHEFQK